MKHTLYFILGLCIILFSSCHHDDDEESIRFTGTSSVKVYANITEASVSFEAGQTWSATTVSSDWITISIASGSKGSNTLNVILSTNYTGTTRTGTINILCDGNTYAVTITQDALNANGEQPIAVAKRTILAYIVAENSLYSFAKDDINEMKQGLANMSENNNLLVYVDDLENPRILRLYKKGTTAMCDTVYQYTTNKVSTDPAVMQEVLNYTVEKYPAEHYGLIMWSHADGWMPATQKIDTRMFGIDNGVDSGLNSGPEMDVTDIASVLNNCIANKTKTKFDFILFDACFMQAVEVAYQLRNCTNYLISSPTEIPGPGAPYQNMIAPMFATTFDAEGMVDAYYNYYVGNSTYGAAISAVKCSELENFASATATALKTLNSFTFASSDVAYYCSAPSTYSRDYYYDINAFMKKMLADADYTTWKKALDSTVPYKKTTSWVYSNYIRGRWTINATTYSGASFYIPRSTNNSKWNTYFKTLDWYTAAGWSSLAVTP